VRHETGVIIEESKEKDLALAVEIGRIGEVGAVHSVALPQVAKVGTLETAIRLGALFGEELGGSRAAAGKLAAQGTWGDAGFGDGVSGVEREDADDGAGGAEGLLAFEGTVLYGQYRASARSRVSGEMARQSPRSERAEGLRPSKPCSR
jgi:hypothetical protein